MKNKRFGGRVYKIISFVIAGSAIAYLLLLYFPQPLFAHSTQFGNLTIHSRQPLPPEMQAVVAKANERLARVPFYKAAVTRQIYLTGGFKMYALLSHKAYRSFANSVPFINNIIINKTDVSADQVIMNSEIRNSRSLSGVIAHEVTHLAMRERYGTAAVIMLPTWKNEGYCEYIAGDTTMSIEEGIRRWRESPNDDTDYRYIKYQLMVQYLLEKQKLSIDELFSQTFDEKDVAAKTLASLE